MKQKIPEKHYDDTSALFQSYINNEIYNKLSGTSSIIDTYEDKLKDWFGVNNAIATSSGSSALLLALYALNIKQDDNIIVSALAPIPTLLPILQAGANIIFVDTQTNNFEFDLQDLLIALDKYKPKCIISVPVWGYPVLTTETIELAKAYNTPIIEDSAHAHGTIENGQFSGTSGIIGCFSTHENKILSTGEGGFILTNNQALANDIRIYSRLGGCDGSKIGFNFKLSGVQALIGNYRLNDMKDNLEKRERIAGTLLSLINSECKLLQEIPYSPHSKPNYYCLGLLFNDASDKNYELINAADSLGMYSNTIKYKIKPSFEYPIFKKYYRNCPNAYILSKKITSIPTHPSLTDQHLEHFFDIINSIWK